MAVPAAVPHRGDRGAWRVAPGVVDRDAAVPGAAACGPSLVQTFGFAARSATSAGKKIARAGGEESQLRFHLEDRETLCAEDRDLFRRRGGAADRFVVLVRGGDDSLDGALQLG